MVTKTSSLDLQNLRKRLESLVGKKVTRVVAGGSAGSIIGMHLGTAFNIAPGALQSEWYLAVECSWRLESVGVPIASSRDENSEGGPMLRGLALLVNQTVSQIAVLEPCLDLSISFVDGTKLFIFCDVLRSGICWYLLGPEDVEFSVEPAGVLLAAR